MSRRREKENANDRTPNGNILSLSHRRDCSRQMMFKTVAELKEFLQYVPDDAFVCPVKDHTIKRIFIKSGIIFDNGDEEWIFDGIRGSGE